MSSPLIVAMLISLAGAESGSPAERLPQPAPERCLGFFPSPDDEDARPDGLSYDQVAPVLEKIIQTALYCTRPPNRKTLDLTFQLTIGCDGLVSSVEAVDDDGAPAEYLQCVSAVIERADFPAHDMAEGMPVTYPVNVRW